MLGFTSLHCAGCRAERPVRFTYLVAGLPALGIKVDCDACRQVAFTLISGRYAYCPVCETLTALRVLESSVAGKVFACCARCDQLYAALHTDLESAAARVQRRTG